MTTWIRSGLSVLTLAIAGIAHAGVVTVLDGLYRQPEAGQPGYEAFEAATWHTGLNTSTSTTTKF
jgi:hypothetical protein